MKISSLICLTSLALSFSVQGMTPTFSEGLVRWEHNGKWGFLNTKGEVAVPFMWDKVGWGFREGLVEVCKADRWGMVDQKGEIVVPLDWDEVGSIEAGTHGYIAVKRSDKWGFVDKEGKVVVKPEWDEVREYSEDLAAVRKGSQENGRWGFVDRGGQVIIAPERWIWVGRFSDGVCDVREGSRKTRGPVVMIDRMGKIVEKEKAGANPEEQTLSKIRDLGYWVQKENEGLYWVMKNGKRGIVDSKAEIVVPVEWDYLGSSFSNGLLMVGKNEKIGFVNAKGELAIPVEWSGPKKAIVGFGGGVSAIRRGNKEGFINAKGVEVIPCEWDEVGNFKRDGGWVARVGRGGKFGMIDKSGKVVVQPEWDWCHPWGFKDGLLRVHRGEKVGFVNREGQLVIPLGGPELGDFLIHEREWTDQNGRKVKAPVLRVEDGKAILVVNEKEMPFPLEKLSAKDRELLEIASK